MSWAAHEFENYFIQKHVGVKASFVAIVVGTALPDLFTKRFVYAALDPAQFHRGWPGFGFTHSFMFGVACAVIVLAVTRSRAFALGLMLGQWAHVVTDIGDTAGVMPFFPFSTENVTIGMWKHAAVEGRHGDAAAYYSSLGGVWDLFWFVIVVVFARDVLRADYFRRVIVPADVRFWSWMRTRTRLTENGLLIVYRGLFLYGSARMVAWFLYARFDAKAPLQVGWGGPQYVAGNDLSDSSILEVLVRTAVGGVMFAGFLWLAWIAFVRRLWQRGNDPPAMGSDDEAHAVSAATRVR